MVREGGVLTFMLAVSTRPRWQPPPPPPPSLAVSTPPPPPPTLSTRHLPPPRSPPQPPLSLPQVDQRERCALFPGRSCLPLSPVEDDSTPEPNLDQLNVIFSVIGTPRASLDWIELPEMRDYLRSLLPVPATPLHDVYPAAPGSAIELLESMLSFEPFERLTVDEVGVPDPPEQVPP